MSDAVSYLSEPATTGKVLLTTTIGDFDVELFGAQAPKAVRNFVQLCMEGYYDGCIFHRVIKQFMAQTGDPTGTGHGGSSAFDGQAFADEFHSRLRFNRRGLLGMASNGRDANQSQFFISLGPCEFLNKKHTLFGKITGETLFNIMKFEELDIENATPATGGDEDDADADSNVVRDRPYNPPRILRTEVLLNPFPDIVPRAKAAPVVEAPVKPKKKQKKNLALLSFGEEEGAEEATLTAAAASTAARAASKSSHDLLRDDARLSRTTVEQALADARRLEQDVVRPADSAAAAGGDEAARQATRDALAKKKSSSATAAAAAAAVDDEAYMDESAFDAHMKMQLLRKKGVLPAAGAPSSSSSSGAAAPAESKQRGGDSDDDDGGDARSKYDRLKAAMGLGAAPASGASSIRTQAVRSSTGPSVDDALLSPLEARRSKYKTRKQNAALSTREQNTLAKLAAFKASVAAAQSTAAKPAPRLVVPEHSDVEIPPVPVQRDEDDDEGGEGGSGEGGSAWLGHSLKFHRRPQDFDPMARDVEGLTYAVVDPRGEEGAREMAGAFGAGGGKKGDRHRARTGTVGLQGGNRGMTGVHKPTTGDGHDSVRYKTVAELEAEEENERVVQRLLDEENRKRKRSRSRSRSQSRDRDRARRSRSRSPRRHS